MFVVGEVRGVVAFVEEFEDGGEDFGVLGGEVEAFGCGEELGAEGLGEVGGFGQDVFVGGEEALGGADAEGYYCGVEVAVGSVGINACVGKGWMGYTEM